MVKGGGLGVKPNEGKTDGRAKPDGVWAQLIAGFLAGVLGMKFHVTGVGLFRIVAYGSWSWRYFSCMGLFNAFSLMIGGLPVAVIPRALELERQMLEADIACHRITAVEQARSILTFCQFFDAAKLGLSFPPTILPTRHIAFYGKTTDRLTEAKLLPAEARKGFDTTFSHSLFSTLNAA
jgi:hypothetical protein